MFKEYAISTLFDSQNGNTDLKKQHINGRGYPVVSSGVENTGIIGYTDVDARIFPAHTITVDMFGNVYYRDFEYKQVTHARVFALIPRDFELNTQTGLYLASSLKRLSKMYSYNNMCSYKKISSMPLSLPVIENPDPDHEYTVDDIDWQYMQERIIELEQERIIELEQERIIELEAYLIASGLDDYELTNEDKEILSLSLSTESTSDKTDASKADFGNGQVAFKAFKVGDVFVQLDLKFIPDRRFDKAHDVSKVHTAEFNLPLVNAKHGNNGVMYYGRKTEWEFCPMTIDVVADGAASVGDVYAQPQDTGVLYNAYLIKPVAKVKSTEALLYMAKCIERVTKKQFSYDNKATWNKVKLCEISLPVTLSGEPDFDYMERYIRAIEKLAIADVVKYKNAVIEATQQVVGSSSSSPAHS